MVTTAAPRRTQAERRATTQARLLDATIECVAELAYHRTTTAEVARRAGLSRTPTCAAWMELSLAATSDPDLRRHMAEHCKRFIVNASATFAEVIPGAAADPGLSIAPLFAFMVLDGLALRHALVNDEMEVGAVLDALKGVSRLVASPADSSTEDGP